MFRNCASRYKLFVYTHNEHIQIYKKFFLLESLYNYLYLGLLLQDANCVFILLECTEKKNLFYERKLTIISSNHLVKHCYNRASKFVSSNLIARACFIFLLSTLMTSANVSLEKKIFHRVENVIKQLVHTSACVHRDMKHAGSLESTKDA